MSSRGLGRARSRTPKHTLPAFRGAAIAALTAVALPAAAGAQQPAAPTVEADGPQAGATEPEPKSKASSDATKQARMRRTEASPRRAFADSGRKARFDFKLAGKKTRTLVVKVKKLSDGKTRRRWRLKDVEPGETQTVTWGGKTRKGGFSRQGKHVFKVYEPGKGKTDMSEANGKKRFRFYRHRFPIRANHTYGDGFGAGRGHQGVDIFAKCGRSLRAVRGGKVEVRAHHGAAGRYIVIDGHGTDRDYVYMHMQRRKRPQVGDRVKTGEKIGFVGETGNASGCHLHFEVWRGPGWYQGGSPVRSIKRMTQRWATYSW
ncbi:MAG TPA: M23 family metallopeptidase [Solirubrobacterales bacterium]|nr:M23 family metallopeptidase [Solirubrobacterales bacterium]